MRVLIASQFHYFAFKGGNEQHAHQLSLGLTRAGHEVVYLSSSILKRNELAYRHESLPVYSFCNQLFLKETSSVVRTELQHADIVHVFGFSPLMLQLLSRAYKHSPRLLTYPADAQPKNIFLSLVSRAYQQIVPYRCDRILTTTTSYEKRLLNRWPNIPIRHVPLMISSHIEADTLTKKQARMKLSLENIKKHVLCVAALSSHHYYKGIPVMLQALRMLPKDIHLHLVGDGDQRTKLSMLAEKLGISDRTTFHGSLDNEAMAPWYKAADLVVLPSTSLSEGFGLSLLEAMYCETPCLTTTIIGPANFYAARRLCRLVRPNDSEALSKAIHAMLTSDNKTMIMRAKAWANTHTTKAMTQKTISVYKEALQDRAL